MRLVALACIGVLFAGIAQAQLATGGRRSVNHTAASRTISATMEPGGSAAYGCSDAVPLLSRPSRVFRAQLAMVRANGEDETVVSIGVVSGRPPGSTALSAPTYVSDVARLWAYEQPTARLKFIERSDLANQWEGAVGTQTATNNARTNEFSSTTGGRCPTGSHSNDASRGDGYCLDRVPICVGGARDGKWAPLDPANGYHATGNAYCPGGTVTLTARNMAHNVYLPRANVLSNLAETFNEPNAGASYNKGWWCTGQFGSSTDCGTGYPSVLANAPSRSLGKYLYDTYGGNTPTHLPLFFLGSYTQGTGSPPFVTGDTGRAEAVVVDLRNAAAQRWAAAAALDHVYSVVRQFDWMTENQKRNHPIAIDAAHLKMGWFSHYDPANFPGDTNYCENASTTKMWRGPASPLTTRSSRCVVTDAGPIMSASFPPGGWETATCELNLSLLEQTDPDGSGFFRNVRFTSEEVPLLRDIRGEGVCAAVRRDPRWIGSRRVHLNSGQPPFSSGFRICTGEVEKAIANGPYVTDPATNCVRLRGRIESPTATATGTWAAVDCAGCTWRDPIVTSATGRTGDPQALLCDVPAGVNTISWTVGGSTQITTVTR